MNKPSSLKVETPSDREVRITRKFKAPAQLVWDAHTKPELVRKWMYGFEGWSLPICEMDVRVGGAYRWVAEQVGSPKGMRAVGQANGKNPICIIVPCHRVIGSDKSLTGYGGGLWRKKWLLQHEFRITHGIQTLF